MEKGDIIQQMKCPILDAAKRFVSTPNEFFHFLYVTGKVNPV